MHTNGRSSPWLTAQDAALYVGRRKKTAYKTMNYLARAGKIRAGHDGKHFVFRPEDLDTWLYLRGKKVIRKSTPSQAD